MELEPQGSWEFLKSKCPLILEAFSADKLLIGNGHWRILKNKNKDLMLSDGDATTYEWRQTCLSVSSAEELLSGIESTIMQPRNLFGL